MLLRKLVLRWFRGGALEDRDLKEGARKPREWKAPTLMIFDVKGHTRSALNPAPNHDASTNYYTVS